MALKDEMRNLTENGQNLSANMAETAASMNEIAATTTSMRGQTSTQIQAAEKTRVTLGDIERHIEELNAAIENQSSCVVESSSSTEEMVANIKSVSSILQKNFSTISNLLTEAESVKTGILGITEFMNRLRGDSEGLLEAVDIIQGISSQTNLLAMNAAIEAAHAGDYGKGFAVVADEIRKLAENSSTQGKTIAKVLKKLKDQIREVAGSSGKTQGDFESIFLLMNDVGNQESVIKNAMEEQDVGSSQVLEAIAEINSITAQVRDGSSRILEGSRIVVGEMERLSDITKEMGDGMDEIVTSTDGINEAIQGVNQIAQNTSGSILRVSEETARFTV